MLEAVVGILKFYTSVSGDCRPRADIPNFFVLRKTMKRITIIGSGGSGKSTLAVRLGNLLQLPVHHLDALYWKLGWVETGHSQWAAIQQSLVSGASDWIIDGNYGGTIDIRLEASDTVIFLDINRFICLVRAVKRTLKHFGKNRADMGIGCNEKLDLSFVRWIYGYPAKKKPKIIEKLSKLDSSVEVYVLKNQAEVELFLSRLALPS